MPASLSTKDFISLASLMKTFHFTNSRYAAALQVVLFSFFGGKDNLQPLLGIHNYPSNSLSCFEVEIFHKGQMQMMDMTIWTFHASTTPPSPAVLLAFSVSLNEHQNPMFIAMVTKDIIPSCRVCKPQGLYFTFQNKFLYKTY